MMKRFVWLGLVALLVVGVAAGCGGTKQPAAQTDGVTIEAGPGLKFTPKTVTVKAGTTVTWVNKDTMEHDAASGKVENGQVVLDGYFRSPMLKPGEKWSFTFDKPGTYPYVCTVPGHAQGGMVGEIVVEP
ncbi:MAG: plastocyanin/azurin family copper-binding protein [Bacillota bacterium]|nr:plastocyanin/azurin family copper-binding protein [Bacillota bacterium]